MFLLNGEPAHCIDPADRGLQYGDGLFETLEVRQGRPLFLDRHLRRLASGCRRLMIPMPDAGLLEAEALSFAAGREAAVLKLIVTRGCGGRGYRQPDVIQPTRLFSLHPYPDYPAHYQTDGIVADFCRQRLSSNATLAGIKHLNRLEQVLARAEWSDDSRQEGLMLDVQNYVVEGTMSNLFIVKSGVLLTPALTDCGVAGIVREWSLAFAAAEGLPSVEAAITVDQVLAADEVFVTNSVIGIWPVRRLAGQDFPVGQVTQRICAAYRLAKQRELS
ncbi:aminodeoxychorismate lyase [Methylomonas sp. UP202]|uniref:aminodeoxychorismate lyase n=1 Tax=Methylomonas sp. UP202 TaxID=3040943 RepID=UPI002479FBD5|nr:aminodeoxychorismate lyase [Methylomonas sp. UP202]WGS84483.1 aminodeoxychorismate lyase [Methylomonas sp. UP202]